jgi:peptidoglycan-associated lipoprotein
MNRSKLRLFAAVNLVVLVALTGCSRKPKAPLTHIPGQRAGIASTQNPEGAMSSVPGGRLPTDPTSGVPIGGGNDIGGGNQTRPVGISEANKDRESLRAHTVYFDFDRATVKSSERSKLQAVADYLKANNTVSVLVEGHCDERGTEGYNLALGDRRALAIREMLVTQLGVPSDNVHTISFGEAKPATQGNDESAWSKNRRGEFVVLRPAQ